MAEERLKTEVVANGTENFSLKKSGTLKGDL